MKPSYRWLYGIGIYVNLMITAGCLLTPNQNTPAVMNIQLGIPVWITGVFTLAGASTLIVLWRNRKRDNTYLIGITPIIWYSFLSMATVILFGGGLAGFGITSGFLALLVVVYFWLNGHH